MKILFSNLRKRKDLYMIQKQISNNTKIINLGNYYFILYLKYKIFRGSSCVFDFISIFLF